MSHHQKEPKFATCGDVCQLWEESRAEPLRVMEWGVDSLQHVAFNPVEDFLLGKKMSSSSYINRAQLDTLFSYFPISASCASDRSIILYDIRDAGPVRKIVTKMRTNQISWNPLEAYTFSGANEDYK